MPQSPLETAERLRLVAFQPLADLLDARFGIDPFTAAAHLLLLNAAGDAASLAHLFATRPSEAPHPWWLGGHALLWLCDAGMARGLLAFSRRSAARDSVRFNPRYRRGHWLGLVLLVSMSLRCATDAAAVLSGRADWSAWGAFHWMAAFAFPVALFLAACEWRRLPPARRMRDAVPDAA